ncbi:MAG: Fe-S cluster assembly protein SufB, partial [Ilumatobacter sp.]|nr:Fe-S cluster assembly protein SufB [Ilumatobacter sp.]
MSESTRTIEELTESDYEFGFSTDLDTDIAPPGLDESIVRLISSKKDEPEWLLEWRLKAYEAWRAMEEPDWAKLEIAPIDYEAISYWAAPKQKPVLDSMDDVDPDIRDMFDKLGIPLHEQKMLSNVAVDAIVDSVSVTTTFKKTLLEAGVIFCSFSEAVR